MQKRFLVFVWSILVSLLVIGMGHAGDEPVFNGEIYAGGRHHNDIYGNEDYAICFRVAVSDPQGLGDIQSVTAAGPAGSGIMVELYDDGQHEDDAAGDGLFGLWYGGHSAPLPTGTYTFTALDSENNLATASDSLEAFPPVPTNLSPSDGDFITTPAPTFSWDAGGSTSCRVNVWDIQNNQVWSKDNINGTAAVYNGTALIEGEAYNWAVYCNDGQGNNGSFYNGTFIYSTTPAPVIIRIVNAGTYHSGVDNGDQQYGLTFYVIVNDPQGISNIASVVAKDPDGNEFTLFDDGMHCDNNANDGEYGRCGWDGNYQQPDPLVLGEYSIIATDQESNVGEKKIQLTTLLDIPHNPSPTGRAFVDTSTPAFTWDAVQGAAHYNIDVRNPDGWVEMWGRNSITGNSVVYNNDGNAQALAEDTLYRWGVGACDDQGNCSWHHTANDFIYSSQGNVFMSEAYAGGRYQNDIYDNEEYAIHFRVMVSDPKGLGNIQSVSVAGPAGTGITVALHDDGQHGDDAAGDGLFGLYATHSAPLPTGTYIFTAVNKDGKSVSATDVVEAFPAAPDNLSPGQDEILFTSTPTFSWQAHNPGNSFIRVLDGRYNEIWAEWQVNGTSIQYAGPEFEAGRTYRWMVGNRDNLGNEGIATDRTFIFYPSEKVEDTYYDRFDQGYWDQGKWAVGNEKVREIKNGALRLNARGDNAGERIEFLPKPGGIYFIASKVKINSSTWIQNGASTAAGISGNFYNDGAGDCWLDIRLKKNADGTFTANASVDDSSENEIADHTFTTQILPDTFYNLSIDVQYTQTGPAVNGQITFKLNEEEWTPALAQPINRSTNDFRRLMSRVYTESGGSGYSRAWFDDVLVKYHEGDQEKTFSDDFSLNVIDQSKWTDQEYIGEVADGALRLGIRGIGQKTTINSSVSLDTDYLEAKALIESGSQVDDGIKAISRISGTFYNDGFGPGSGNDYNEQEGDVFADLRLVLEPGGHIKATASLWRSNNSDFSMDTELFSSDFTQTIQPDVFYRLSIEKADANGGDPAKIIFRCNTETLVYNILTDVYPPYGKWKSLTSRVYATEGTAGLITSRFDDVRIFKRKFELSHVITILRMLAGVMPQELPDVEDIGNNTRMGLEEAVYLMNDIVQTAD